MPHLSNEPHATFVTLSQTRDEELWGNSDVYYERVEAVFDAELCIIVKMTSKHPPIKLLLTLDELDALIAARLSSPVPFKEQ